MSSPDADVTTTLDRPRDADSTDRSSPIGRLALAGALVGLLCVTVPSAVVAVAERLVPWRGEISSRGTNFEPFAVIAPTIVRRSGVAILLAVAVMLLAGRVRWRSIATAGRERLIVAGIVGAATALWYGWLAEPHNAYPSNARFHWVDYLTWDSDKYFYAAGRIPHLLFYDHPYVWQGINAAIIVALVAWIGWKLELSLPAFTAMVVTPALATNLWLYAGTAEDVMLNFALLLGVLCASIARRPVVLGVCLALAGLGRPSFLVLVLCVPVAEYLVALRAARHPIRALRGFDRAFATVAVGTALLATLLAQVLFTVIGNRYLLTEGRLVYTPGLDRQEPIDVDGFVISAFSGVYTLHVLWILPLAFLLGTAVALWSARRYDGPTAASTYFAALGAAAILILHESQPVSYYNVRYISYLWPFLFVASWIAYSRTTWPSADTRRAGVVVLLVLGSMVLPADPVAAKRRVEARAETELLAVRDELDELHDDQPIVATFGNSGTRNLLAYVTRSNVNAISVATSDVEPGDLVVTRRSEPLLARPADLATDSLLIYDITDDDAAELVRSGS